MEKKFSNWFLPIEHPEHGITADSEERCSHSLDVFRIDSGVTNQHLGLADDLRKMINYTFLTIQLG